VSEIWKHRNNVIFNRGKADVTEVFAIVQVKIWSWIYLSLVLGCSPIPIGVWILWFV